MMCSVFGWLLVLKEVVTITPKSIVKHLLFSAWWRMIGQCCCCFFRWICAAACGCTDRHRCEWLGGGHSLWVGMIVMIWGSEQQADAKNGRRKRRRAGGWTKAEMRRWRLDRSCSRWRQRGVWKGGMMLTET